MHQFFICNQTDIELKVKALTKTGTSDSGWTDFYIDKSKNENWVLTRYKTEYHGGGVAILKRLPDLSIDELIDIAITSTDIDNILGASLELSEREKYKNEDFRDKLISRLLLVDISDTTEFEKERLKIIIYESDLYDAINRRDIVGKSFAAIENDAKYFRRNAQVAKRILADIEKYSS